MSVLGFAGGELGNTSELSNVSGISMNTSFAHGGKYSYQVSNGGVGFLLFPARPTPIYVRGYFYSLPGHTTYTNILSIVDASLAMIAAVYVYAPPPTQGGQIQLNSNTQAWAGTTAFPEGIWHRLEVCYVSGGYCEVRVNGRREIVRGDFVAPTAAAGIAIVASTPGTGSVLWDDLHVTEDGYPGPGYVLARQSRLNNHAFVALTAPTYDAFTKNGAGNWIDYCWGDTPANAATNASSTAANQTQTTLVEALSGGSMGGKYGPQFLTPRDTIYGAKVYAHGHRVGASPEHYIVRANAGVLTRSGPYTFPTLDTVQGTEIFQATLSQLDAMEIGVARGASASGANLVVNDVWLMVSYATAPVPMVHFTGFETGSLTELTGRASGVSGGIPSVGSGVSIDTAHVRSGVYAAKSTPSVGNGYFRLHPDPIEAPMLWVRLYVYLTALPSNKNDFFVMTDLTVYTTQLVVSILPDGRAQLTVGATSATTVSPVFVVGAWNYVEAVKRATLLPGDGFATVWINDQVLTIPIAETGGAMSEAYCSSSQSVGFTTLWFDDVAVSEIGRIGPGRVLARQGIAGTPTDQAWSLNGAGTIEQIWSNTPVNTGTFSQATNINTAQTMRVNPQANGGAFLGPTDTIITCRVVASARYSTGAPPNGGPTSLRYRVQRSGLPVLVKDSNVSIISTTTSLVYGEVFTTILDYLNTIEIGAQHGPASNGVGMIVDDLWLMVAYADLQILDLPLPSVPAPVAIVEIQL